MDERAKREKNAYDSQLLQRKAYDNITSQTRSLYKAYSDNIIRMAMNHANAGDILELGSRAWKNYIYANSITPKSLSCINISQTGLKKGIKKSRRLNNFAIDFLLMDANNLSFKDKSFDMVYGEAILHHLNFEQSLSEIYRVLKKGGRIFFNEPLGINPISKIIRYLTPRARTPDEKPLGNKEIKTIEKFFDVTFYYEQLFSVPIGILSQFVSKRSSEKLAEYAFILDRKIDDSIPSLRPLFREIYIHGVKKNKYIEECSVL